MNKLDQTGWLAGQYKTDANLRARMNLHRRFGAHAIPWQQWVFAKLALPDSAHVLEIGCGPGALWQENAACLLPGWTIVLSDLSPGMVEQARRNLQPSGQPVDSSFQYIVGDVQSIPCVTGVFDVVIANHMLYHVPDRVRALAEIARAATGRPLLCGDEREKSPTGATHISPSF